MNTCVYVSSAPDLNLFCDLCVCSIWVLFEMDDEGDADPGPKWRSFRSEDELTQLVKRVVGEPLRIPPPSLAPQASEQIVSPSHIQPIRRRRVLRLSV